MSWAEQLAAELAAVESFPPVSEQTRQLGEHLDREHPGVGWLFVLALTHRLMLERPGMCVPCIARVCTDRGWFAEDPAGRIPHPDHDGVVRTYRLTDVGRAAGAEVMP